MYIIILYRHRAAIWIALHLAYITTTTSYVHTMNNKSQMVPFLIGTWLLTLGACARVTVVVLCVCVSVTNLAAAYLICESKVQLCKLPYSVPNACIVWISLKTLCSPVLASFADSKLHDFSPASGGMT